MSEQDIKKYVNANSSKIKNILSKNFKTNKSLKNLFADSRFITENVKGRKSVDRSKVKVKKSLLHQYQKSNKLKRKDLK